MPLSGWSLATAASEVPNWEVEGGVQVAAPQSHTESRTLEQVGTGWIQTQSTGPLKWLVAKLGSKISIELDQQLEDPTAPAIGNSWLITHSGYATYGMEVYDSRWDKLGRGPIGSNYPSWGRRQGYLEW